MRIIVIVKHVPDSRIALRVRMDGSGIEQDGVKYVCDPFDEIAVEQAVQLKAARTNIEEILALAVAPSGASATETLRHALAMGADRAVHILCDDLQPHEELRAATLCAAAISGKAAGFGPLSFDLLLCGARSTDNAAGEFGPALAELLDVPHAGAVTQIELGEDRLSARSRTIPGGEILLDIRWPAVVTCERGLAEPRQPSLPKLMKAKREPIHTIDAAEFGVDPWLDASLVRLAPPAARQPCRFIEGEPAQMARELVRLLREEAQVL
jgi:electron transfer flavoprotein beta subunit